MKKLMISVLLLLMSATGMAQEGKGWSITPRVGLNVARLSGDADEYVKDKTGLSAGAEVECRFSRFIGLSTGLMYANIGSKENTIEIVEEKNGMSITYTNPRYNLEYLQLPILLNIHPTTGLTLKTGLHLDYLLGAHQKRRMKGWYYIADPDQTEPYIQYEWSKVPKKRIDVDKDSKASIKKAIKDFELVIPLGVSYEYRHIVLDASYHFGISDAFHSEVEMMNRYFQVTLGYRFGL